jgi:tRNA G18 (ribose-2'-O)-methylase SpoU
VSGRLPDSAFEHLREPQWLRTHGLFVAEGRHVATRLIQSPRMSLVSLMLSPTARTAMAGVIEAAGLSEDTVLVREQEELDRITGLVERFNLSGIFNREVVGQEFHRLDSPIRLGL